MDHAACSREGCRRAAQAAIATQNVTNKSKEDEICGAPVPSLNPSLANTGENLSGNHETCNESGAFIGIPKSIRQTPTKKILFISPENFLCERPLPKVLRVAESGSEPSMHRGPCQPVMRERFLG
jgi:hypothetical protein